LLNVCKTEIMPTQQMTVSMTEIPAEGEDVTAGTSQGL